MAATGFRIASKMLVDVLPMLLIAFVLAGMVRALIPAEIIVRYLGKEAGFKGIILACAAGAVSPGGPFINFPLVAMLYQAGASIGAVVGFVTAWALWPGVRMIWEISILGPKVALIRLAATIAFPPIAGLIAQAAFHKVA